MSAHKIFLFEDYDDSWLELLQLLLKRNSPPISSFVQQTARTIRREIKSDNVLSSRTDLTFTTLHELAEKVEREPKGWPFAIKAAITCASQIGLFLGYAQNHEDIFAPCASRSLGLGIGSLVAAVAISARGINHAMDLSQPVIALSFRMGALMEQKLEHRLGNSRWASVRATMQENEAQETVIKFNQQNSLRMCDQCYVTTVLPSESIISGPLPKVEALRNSRGLTAKISSSLPFGIPGLYSIADMSHFDKLIDDFENVAYDPSDPASSTLDHVNVLRSTVLQLLSSPKDLIKSWKDPTEVSGEQKFTIVTLRSSSIYLQFAKHLQMRYQHVDIKLEDALPNNSDRREDSQRSPIAIIGMSGRFPGARNIEEFWNLLQAGKDVHRTVPSDRFNYHTHTDSTGQEKNTSKSPYGCFIDDPGLFDSRFFDMSPKEAMQTDPAQRLMILTAYEALEMAGFVPNRTPSSRPDRVATFYGQASDDWREVNSSQDIGTYFIPGGIRAFGPGRINYHLKLSGPSYSIDTACSSSFAAINAACNSLWAGDCDMAISGGANIMTNPDIFAGLSRGHFLSSTGSCKTFDSDADGYCRADGVGSIVLKRLDDAESDHDNILGIITGIGTNHSANAVSITHPHAPTQSLLYRSLLSNNNVDPHEVSYVEMHGTGTAAGDYNEMLSVSDVFAPQHRSTREHPLYVGSVKANVGHAEAAAGITSLIKVLLMLRHSAIPPHVGIKGKVNPAFPVDLDQRHVRIPLTSKSWTRRSDNAPRTAFLNNFSAAGGNTALILRENNRSHSPRRTHPHSSHILNISAKTSRSLHRNIEELAGFLSKNPQTELADLSYTLTARRASYAYRKSAVVTDLVGAESALRSWTNEEINPVNDPPKIVFTFTGQGSLYTSLARRLLETCAQFRDDILEFDSLAQAEGFSSFLSLIDGTVSSPHLLSPTEQQVGQVCVQLALARLWMSWGIQPSLVVGHSLGEYAALAVAGVLSAADMIFLVGSRAQLLERHCKAYTSGMLAVNSDAESLAADIARLSVEIACRNGPRSTVLGGTLESLERCANVLRTKGYRCIPLPVAHAYHTAQVDSILGEFASLAKRVDYARPNVPVLSPLLGGIADTDTIGPDYLCRHARETVDFHRAVSALRESPEWDEQTLWLEVGPHPTCVKLVQQMLGSAHVLHSLERDLDPWETLSNSVSALYEKGFTINWDLYHAGFEEYYRLVELPAYAWDLRNFWIDYNNDWCLRKGDDRPIEAPPPPAAITLSTSVHRVLEKHVDIDVASLVAESDFADAALQQIANGHRVNGISLCPSSLYADMAFTVARYLHQCMRPDTPIPALDVRSMKVDKPFIIESQPKVLFRIAASATPISVKLRLYSVDRHDAKIQTTHAECEVFYSSVELWALKWGRQSYLVRERITALERASVEGRAHRIQRSLIYRLFSSFVDYDFKYQGIEEIILDGPNLEATARVVLKPVEAGSTFDVPATWIDSICHLTGAILNASDAVDPKTSVYISHGWKSLRIGVALETEKSYRTYTRMQETSEGIMEGDVWVFDNDRVIGLAKGVKFQRIARRVIDHLLPNPEKIPASAIITAKQASDLQRQTPNAPQPQLINPEIAAIPLRSDQAPNAVEEVLAVIATECAVDREELTDGCRFASLGIDSLLSLEILARLRESFGIDLRPSVFLENGTIADLKKQLIQVTDGVKTVASEPSTGSPTPVASNRTITPSISAPIIVRTPSATLCSSSVSSFDHDDVMEGVLLPNDAHSRSGSITSISSTVPTDLKPSVPLPSAVSYLLSGDSRSATKTLFIFPDGSGSATSYATLPPLGPNICVYALNCPFMTEPSAWNSGIAVVTSIYLKEIRRRQPRGSYNLAGWSAGGILAYEAARQLATERATVDRLILIDSPCPVNLPPMPIKMFTFLDSMGLLGSGNAKGTPDWVIPHFEATVRNLDTYTPLPFPPRKQPSVTAIWAAQGVTSVTGGRRPLPHPNDPAIMNWLLEDRTEFGSNGWEALLPIECIRSDVMAGHHFSMTNEHANELGQLMARAMASNTSLKI